MIFLRLNSTGDEVRKVQERLHVAATGTFDDRTRQAVEHFQARMGLVTDGIVGPLTWAALFPVEPSALARMLLSVARRYVGESEEPRGSNRGPFVDRCHRACKLSPEAAHPWCASFVALCGLEASQSLGVKWPLPIRAGAQNLYRDSPIENRQKRAAPGDIGCMKFTGGRGHCFIVEVVNGDLMTTIDGNSSEDGSREGYMVARLERRRVSDPKMMGVLRV